MKIRNTSESEAVLRPPLALCTDCGTIGLGQYNGLGEYYGPHTTSSVFVIIFLQVRWPYTFQVQKGPGLGRGAGGEERRTVSLKGDVKRKDNTLRKHVNNKVYHNIDIVT